MKEPLEIRHAAVILSLCQNAFLQMKGGRFVLGPYFDSPFLSIWRRWPFFLAVSGRAGTKKGGTPESTPFFINRPIDSIE